MKMATPEGRTLLVKMLSAPVRPFCPFVALDAGAPPARFEPMKPSAELR